MGLTAEMSSAILSGPLEDEPTPVPRVSAAAGSAVYVGYADRARPVRHASLVPLLTGLEALCGVVLTETVAADLQLARRVVTCEGCRLVLSGGR
ncbi:hypothetical protein SAMN05443575_3232 [Jatrophihabitans endophyticus]|uniref:Uncharacterized protein n=1 Tax=Jatrophihabitans endophyticus TaxID=1206085 RepID=A0A1M5PXX3_9ACTN|nr:hypothetical protein [Jatrophihabitans endophyticus]SHH06664.1 hypothetical protein SAMN05443575_3232 [Jatrophihabitans endophyticus]